MRPGTLLPSHGPSDLVFLVCFPQNFLWGFQLPNSVIPRARRPQANVTGCEFQSGWVWILRDQVFCIWKLWVPSCPRLSPLWTPTGQEPMRSAVGPLAGLVPAQASSVTLHWNFSSPCGALLHLLPWASPSGMLLRDA